MTELHYQRLNFASGLELEAGRHRDRVHCVRGRGRGSHVGAAAGVASLWICLRGQLEVDTADGPFGLQGRQFLYLPGTHRARGVARDAADWMVLSFAPERLRRTSPGGARRGFATHLYPVALPMRRALLRSVVSLLRTLENGGGASAEIVIDSLLLDAVDAQAPVNAWIERACGRSEGHRRQVLLRLLSPRNRILNEPFASHDLGSLAAAARYSKSHFLRLFRDVFGQTPHDLLIEARMELAKDLIAGSDMAIAEVAASVGYESRYAFSRLFKKRVGTTASDFRQESATVMRKAA